MPSTNVLNIENLTRLIDAIEQESAAKFDMSVWSDFDGTDSELSNPDVPPCGTAACIGGMADLLSGREKPKYDQHWGRWYIGTADIAAPDAGAWLGLEQSMAEELFFAHEFSEQNDISHHKAYRRITQKAAISALKEIRDTGKFSGWGKHVLVYGAAA